jgi:hypothetical protein
MASKINPLPERSTTTTSTYSYWVRQSATETSVAMTTRQLRLAEFTQIHAIGSNCIQCVQIHTSLIETQIVIAEATRRATATAGALHVTISTLTICTPKPARPHQHPHLPINNIAVTTNSPNPSLLHHGVSNKPINNCLIRRRQTSGLEMEPVHINRRWTEGFPGTSPEQS